MRILAVKYHGFTPSMYPALATHSSVSSHQVHGLLNLLLVVDAVVIHFQFQFVHDVVDAVVIYFAQYSPIHNLHRESNLGWCHEHPTSSPTHFCGGSLMIMIMELLEYGNNCGIIILTTLPMAIALPWLMSVDTFTQSPHISYFPLVIVVQPKVLLGLINRK